MTSTSSVTVRKFGDFELSTVTVTWNNADLTVQDVKHQLAKGVRPVALGSFTTAAGSNVATYRYAFDDTNGEVDIIADKEVGGSVASMVSVHQFLSVASANQDATSITP